MARTAVQYATIAQSGTLSGEFDLRNISGPVTLHIPVVTSGDMFLLASDVAGGDFRRIHHLTAEAPGGGAETAVLNIDVNAGSMALSMDTGLLGGAGFVKVEMGAAQEAVRSLAMLVRL